MSGLSTVFYNCVSFILLHRLSHVEMVRDKNFARSISYADAVCPRLFSYTPTATIVRLLTTNFLIAYITSWVLYLSGASEDPRMLLPAWVSIATVTLTALRIIDG